MTGKPLSTIFPEIFIGEELHLLGSLDHLNSLIHLDSESFPFPWSQKEWVDFLESHQQQTFIIFLKEDQKGPVRGFCLWNTNSVDSFAHLLKIVVTPKSRNIGMGSVLMNQSLSFLRKIGIKSFYLEVATTNHLAIKTYEKYGFRKIHEKKQFYSNGDNSFIMTLVD
jgi:ribosomal-protein-alanine N-acetyltransferase